MKLTKLKLARSVYSTIQNNINNKSLVEQVGLIFGVITLYKAFIEDFVEMKNLDSSPRSFSIDYELLIQYIEDYQTKKKVHLGFFHTHLRGHSSHPSKMDQYYMKLWPSPYIWLIGTSPNSLLAFTWYQNEITQISYTVI